MPLALPYHTCIRDKMSDALYHPLEKLSFNKLPHPPPRFLPLRPTGILLP